MEEVVNRGLFSAHSCLNCSQLQSCDNHDSSLVSNTIQTIWNFSEKLPVNVIRSSRLYLGYLISRTSNMAYKVCKQLDELYFSWASLRGMAPEQRVASSMLYGLLSGLSQCNDTAMYLGPFQGRNLAGAYINWFGFKT